MSLKMHANGMLSSTGDNAMVPLSTGAVGKPWSITNHKTGITDGIIAAFPRSATASTDEWLTWSNHRNSLLEHF